MIQIKNLSKKYDRSGIFENASLTFPDHGLVCILGPSGCGKTTLLNILAGFDSRYEGEVSICGSSLSEMDASELCAYRREHVGFVFQNYHLLSGYLAVENVLLAADVVGENPEAEQEARELLGKLGLSDKVDKRIETLSGGQKQRVAIARALLNDPSVILADEPTGALDRKNSTEIMELLKKLSESRLVIVITHDKKCAEYAERIVTIEDGKLLCDKPVEKGEGEAAKGFKKRDTPKISLWKRAYKNFKVHLPRYLAVSLAISLGVVCVGLSLSSGNIMEKSITEFEEKNTAYHNGYIRTENDEKELLNLLEKDQRLENIYEQYVLQDISVKVGDQTVNLEEKFPLAKATEKMSYGRMPRRGENEIVLNPSLASKFDRDLQGLIGEKAELEYRGKVYELTISGIFNGIYDDYFVSSDVEQEMYEGLTEKVYAVSYDVAEFEQIVAVSENLKEQGISSQNASAEVAAFLNTFHNLRRLFLTVSVLVFAIGIFISAILLVKQQNTRYREVGLLSALGYTKSSISKILFYENAGLAALSALESTLLSCLAVLIGKTAGFPFVFSIGQILGTLGLTAVLILLIGYVSGRKLLNTEPAEALRK